MPIIHSIPLTAVRRGDHVYTSGGFCRRIQRQGIIVAGSDFNRSEKWLVIRPEQEDQRGHPQLHLITIDDFMNSYRILRRVLYNQEDGPLHHMKITGTSYVEQALSPDIIVQNARILFEASIAYDVDKKALQNLIGEKYERFPYICSTTNSRNWTIKLNSSVSNHELFPNNVSISPEQNVSLKQEKVYTTSQIDKQYVTGLDFATKFLECRA